MNLGSGSDYINEKEGLTQAQARPTSTQYVRNQSFFIGNSVNGDKNQSVKLCIWTTGSRILLFLGD
jgi:hypothetical protein